MSDAKAIGQLLASAAPAAVSRTPGVKKVWFGATARTFQPVRRKSFHVGDRERTVWRRIADGSKREGRRFAGAMLHAARRYDRAGKARGKANGHLGHVAIEVLDELLRLVDFATGRLEPALATLCERTRRSKQAVVAALARLRMHGFVDWIRRTVPIEDPDPFGPQVKQTSNAYGFDVSRLPEEVRHQVKAILDKGPPPPDDAWRAEPADTQAEMIGRLPLSEQGSAWRPDDRAAAASLDRIGAMIEARESAENRTSRVGSNASPPDGLSPGTSG